VEVIVGKNRNGPTNTIHLTWLGNFMRFEDFDPRFSTV
jgi:replicative DNA helicase